MKNLLIVGAGGHGRVVADAAIEMGQWNQIAFVDDRISIAKTKLKKVKKEKWQYNAKIVQFYSNIL